MRLKDKVAIVTGGASGIGRAICEVFAEEGARLAIADIDTQGGEETVRRVRAEGGEAIFVETDVSREVEVEAMVTQTAAAYGAVNILVNDAAVFEFGKVEDVTDEQWQRVFGVNVLGQAYCVKHVMPHMKAAGGGAIVNIASVSGFIAAACLRSVQRLQGRSDAAHPMPGAGPGSRQHPRQLRLPRRDTDPGHGAAPPVRGPRP